MNGDKTLIFKLTLILVLILFSLRLFYLQVYNSDYRSLSEENIVHLETVYPSRGIIVDRNDSILVENKPSYDFYIIPRKLSVMDTSSLLNAFSMTKNQFKELYFKAKNYSSYRPSLFYKDMSHVRFAEIQTKLYHFKGIYHISKPTRSYPFSSIVSLFSNPLAFTFIISSLIIYSYPITIPSYMILLTASLFSFFSNGSVLLYFFRKKDLISSASVSHIGLAIMLIGILFSSGYSSIVSKNYTGLIWNNDFPDDVNEDNMLLFVNEERNVGDFRVSYEGERKKLKNYSGFINKNFLELIPLENKYILKKDLTFDGVDLKENDTLDVDNNDITYFELSFKKEEEAFTLFPKVQTDPNSDMIVFSPDVSKDLFQDLYVHVRTYPDPKQEIKWSVKDSISVPIDETFFLNDYVSRLLKVSTKTISEDSKQFIAEAQIKILASGQDYIARPAFIIDDNKVGIVPDIIDDLGIKVSLTEIIPEEGLFKITYQTTQKNWVIVEAMQKPFINFMWLGFFILTLGLLLSFKKLKLSRI